MALVRTDYGLIYNTDGSLCATLLPEGGVAVDKPATNYTDAKTPPTLLVPADWGIEQLGSYKWKIYAKKDNPGVGDQYNRVAFFAGQYGAMANEPVTHSAYVIKNTDNLYVDAFGFGNIDDNKDGNRIWRTIAHTATWTHRQAVSCTNPSQIKLGDYIVVDMPQLEASSHPTAFVDGSRPVGQLSYSGDKINIDHTTWHFEWKPFQNTDSMAGQATYPVIFAVGDYSRNSMVLWFYGQQITLMIRGATDTSWSALRSWTPPSGWYQTGKKYKVTIQIIDKTTFKVFIDGQKIIETTISDPFSASVANQKISVGNFNTNEGFANAAYYNLRMVHDRYVSEEEILTWHSLDAPFFDPREQIDSAGRPVHGAGWEADQNGLRSNVVDPETERPLFEITPDGNAYFGGILRAGLVQSTSSVVVAAFNASFRMKAGADLTCDGTGDQEEINAAIGEQPPLATGTVNYIDGAEVEIKETLVPSIIPAGDISSLGYYLKFTSGALAGNSYQILSALESGWSSLNLLILDSSVSEAQVNDTFEIYQI